MRAPVVCGLPELQPSTEDNLGSACTLGENGMQPGGTTGVLYQSWSESRSKYPGHFAEAVTLPRVQFLRYGASRTPVPEGASTNARPWGTRFYWLRASTTISWIGRFLLASSFSRSLVARARPAVLPCDQTSVRKKDVPYRWKTSWLCFGAATDSLPMASISSGCCPSVRSKIVPRSLLSSTT